MGKVEDTEKCTLNIHCAPLLLTNLDSILKSRHITLLTKVQRVKAMSSSHAQMQQLDHKEG